MERDGAQTLWLRGYFRHTEMTQSPSSPRLIESVESKRADRPALSGALGH